MTTAGTQPGSESVSIQKHLLNIDPLELETEIISQNAFLVNYSFFILPVCRTHNIHLSLCEFGEQEAEIFVLMSV